VGIDPVAKVFKLVSIQALIFLVGLELFLNLFSPFPDPYRSVGGLTKYHKYLPVWNHHSREPPFTSVLVTGPLIGVSTRKVAYSVNRFGFLYDESAGHRTDKEELRIGVIGGSTVECAALENDKRWPNRLQQYLASLHPDRRVTVLNMGMSQQDTRTHLATVAQVAVKLQLNYLVFMLGANDLFRTRPVFRPLTDWDSFLPAAVGPDNFFKLLVTRLQLGRGLRLALHRLKEMPQPTANDSEPYFRLTADWLRNISVYPDRQIPIPPEALADYELNLISLFALATAHGITPIFVTQPMLWKPVMTPDEEAVDWGRDVVDGKGRMSSAEAARNLEALNHRLMTVCHERGWRCIDSANEVPRSLDYFYDYAHFNEAGAEFVAKEVGQFLNRLEH
jgi:lysophospholipase L1-like esterase